MARKPNENLSDYPGMVKWFDPFELIRIVQGVILSAWFGKYADQRVIQGVEDKRSPEKLLERADLTNIGGRKPDDTTPVYIDYVSDIADGFDSTYAIAHLLAQKRLELENGLTIPRGEALVIGGDLIYPDASRENYWERMRQPYMLAFPKEENDGDDENHPPLYAIPGNHDWYDGLSAFYGIFCRANDEKPKHDGLLIGNWRCKQTRSYFAIKLPHNWWIWGVDSQLSGYIDQPQVDYFKLMADEMDDDAKVIICYAKPSWVYAKDPDDKEYQSFKYIAHIAQSHRSGDAKKKNHRVKAFISGDLHHYSRYETKDGDLHYVTAGGGGAFLHTTHTLKPTLSVPDIREDLFDENRNTPSAQIASTRQTVEKIKSSKAKERKDVICYPSQVESRRLMRRNLLFPFINWKFCIALGLLYALISWFFIDSQEKGLFGQWTQAMGTLENPFIIIKVIASDLAYKPGLALMTISVFILLCWYADIRHSSRIGTLFLKLLVGLPHAFLHVTLFIGLAMTFLKLNATLPFSKDNELIAHILYIAEMALIGGMLGGFILGFYLTLTTLILKMHMNEASSSLSIDSYKNFLRLKLTEDSLTIYPIGLQSVPKRQDWVKNEDPNQVSKFVSKNPLKPFLIEEPVVIKTD